MASTATSSRLSERVERALELYVLIFDAQQPTESRYAELDRLLRVMELKESDQYYRELDRRYRSQSDAASVQLNLQIAIRRAEELVEWS